MNVRSLHTQNTSKSLPGRSLDVPGRSRRGQNRAKIEQNRSWRDLGESKVPKDVPRTLPKRGWRPSGRSLDAPGRLPGRLGTLQGGPGTLPRRLGERSVRVFRATFAKWLAERLAERISCDFSSSACRRWTAPMCTIHQFYWVRSTIAACAPRTHARTQEHRKNSDFDLENRAWTLENDARAPPERTQSAATSVRTPWTHAGQPKI